MQKKTKGHKASRNDAAAAMDVTCPIDVGPEQSENETCQKLN